jgi:histidine triad (HIT) family protein
MDTCTFCKIIKQEISVSRVYEDENTIVIKDINPQAPIHLLAIPRKHYSNIHDLKVADRVLFQELFSTIIQTIEKEKLDVAGYRLVVNSGEIALQTVPHIHVHILSGRPLHWPPG